MVIMIAVLEHGMKQILIAQMKMVEEFVLENISSNVITENVFLELSSVMVKTIVEIIPMRAKNIIVVIELARTQNSIVLQMQN
jgi:hypothetical protein